MTPGAAACALAGIVVTFAITCIFVIATRRDQERYEPRHVTAPQPALPPEVHHEELPSAGQLAMLPPDPPPDDTIRIPHAVGTWGMSVTELLDQMETAYGEAAR